MSLNMATVDQKSVRDEIERIKNEFDRLSMEAKIPQESKLLFQSMLMLINLLISIFMEKTTKKNNKNSSIPSSKTDKDESSTGKTKTNGKEKKQGDATVNNTRTVETVTIASVTHCDICGQNLKDAACEHIERRTKIDIIFEKVIEHVDAEVKYCNNCDTTVKGKFPDDMSGPLQYGHGLKAYIINLLISQMMSLNRIQKLVQAMIGELLSEATLLKFVSRLNQRLADWEAKAIEILLNNPS